MALEEQDLIRLCQAGDPNAFEILLAHYEVSIYNLTFRYFGNHHDASDIGQEAMVRIYQRIRDFNGKSTFKTWMYRVVVNLCLDELRRRKNISSSFDEIKEKGYEPADRSFTPEEVVENAERSQMVQEILAMLAEEHRTVLILKDVEELEYHEIAQVLGCNIGTVKSRLSRARESFRKKIATESRFNILAEWRARV